MTVSEREVLELMAKDWTDERIGRALSKSPATVRFHVRNILRKRGHRRLRALLAEMLLKD